MYDKKTSAVFGLNWAQPQEPIAVSGTYDPETELWTPTGPVTAGPLTGADDVAPTRGTLTGTVGLPTATNNNLDTDQHGDGDVVDDNSIVPLES